MFHSIVWMYLGDEGQGVVREAIERAGANATAEGPIAWLRLEPDDVRHMKTFEVRLTAWPGGEERLLATSAPHGPPVRWLA